MELVWRVNPDDARRLREFVAAQQDNPFVRVRIRRNVEQPPTGVTIAEFWEQLVGCLLTSQQRSGPGSPVARIIGAKPFALSFAFLQQQHDRVATARQVLTDFGGIRFTNLIPERLALNLAALEADLWPRTEEVLASMVEQPTPSSERSAAEFINTHYVGFGPKQARNLLQGLGLTRYEIPIDSRITKWLNRFGFPLVVSAAALADEHYYNLISDGIQAMCRECGILPCVLDAAIFSSYDSGWTDDNVI